MISGRTGTMVMAGAALVIAGVIVTSMLLVTRPSIIQISEGTFKIIELPYTYTRRDAYILVVGSAIFGMMISYILIILFAAERSEVKNVTMVQNSERIPVDTIVSTTAEHVIDNSNYINGVLIALEGDEKKLMKEVCDHGGEILQNELTLDLNFSKAKVSRILNNLEKRGLIVKKQYGLTNKVALADRPRGEKSEK